MFKTLLGGGRPRHAHQPDKVYPTKKVRQKQQPTRYRGMGKGRYVRKSSSTIEPQGLDKQEQWEQRQTYHFQTKIETHGGRDLISNNDGINETKSKEVQYRQKSTHDDEGKRANRRNIMESQILHGIAEDVSNYEIEETNDFTDSASVGNGSLRQKKNKENRKSISSIIDLRRATKVENLSVVPKPERSQKIGTGEVRVFVHNTDCNEESLLTDLAQRAREVLETEERDFIERRQRRRDEDSYHEQKWRMALETMDEETRAAIERIRQAEARLRAQREAEQAAVEQTMLHEARIRLRQSLSAEEDGYVAERKISEMTQRDSWCKRVIDSARHELVKALDEERIQTEKQAVEEMRARIKYLFQEEERLYQTEMQRLRSGDRRLEEEKLRSFEKRQEDAQNKIRRMLQEQESNVAERAKQIIAENQRQNEEWRSAIESRKQHSAKDLDEMFSVMEDKLIKNLSLKIQDLEDKALNKTNEVSNILDEIVIKKIEEVNCKFPTEIKIEDCSNTLRLENSEPDGKNLPLQNEFLIKLEERIMEVEHRFLDYNAKLDSIQNIAKSGIEETDTKIKSLGQDTENIRKLLEEFELRQNKHSITYEDKFKSIYDKCESCILVCEKSKEQLLQKIEETKQCYDSIFYEDKNSTSVLMNLEVKWQNSIEKLNQDCKNILERIMDEAENVSALHKEEQEKWEEMSKQRQLAEIQYINDSKKDNPQILALCNEIENLTHSMENINHEMKERLQDLEKKLQRESQRQNDERKIFMEEVEQQLQLSITDIDKKFHIQILEQVEKVKQDHKSVSNSNHTEENHIKSVQSFQFSAEMIKRDLEQHLTQSSQKFCSEIEKFLRDSETKLRQTLQNVKWDLQMQIQKSETELQSQQQKLNGAKKYVFDASKEELSSLLNEMQEKFKEKIEEKINNVLQQSKEHQNIDVSDHKENLDMMTVILENKIKDMFTDNENIFAIELEKHKNEIKKEGERRCEALARREEEAKTRLELVIEEYIPTQIKHAERKLHEISENVLHEAKNKINIPITTEAVEALENRFITSQKERKEAEELAWRKNLEVWEREAKKSVENMLAEEEVMHNRLKAFGSQLEIKLDDITEKKLTELHGERNLIKTHVEKCEQKIQEIELAALEFKKLEEIEEKWRSMIALIESESIQRIRDAYNHELKEFNERRDQRIQEDLLEEAERHRNQEERRQRLKKLIESVFEEEDSISTDNMADIIIEEEKDFNRRLSERLSGRNRNSINDKKEEGIKPENYEEWSLLDNSSQILNMDPPTEVCIRLLVYK